MIIKLRQFKFPSKSGLSFSFKFVAVHCGRGAYYSVVNCALHSRSMLFPFTIKCNLEVLKVIKHEEKLHTRKREEQCSGQGVFPLGERFQPTPPITLCLLFGRASNNGGGHSKGLAIFDRFHCF